LKYKNINYQTVDFSPETNTVLLIEQNLLPFEFKIVESKTCEETCLHIEKMTVRGAGAIGGAAALAMAQAAVEATPVNYLASIATAKKRIESTRPTAQNYFCNADAEACKQIGLFGNELIPEKANIETHCNAGSLAFVDNGSALAPIFEAAKTGKKVFVFVDETAPRNQGARLTAFELLHAEIDHAIIPDNAGAFFMWKGEVDLMITGADRIAANGDTANKIGTFEKAIAAKAFNIPFYIAAPSSTFDFNCPNGKQIPIEYRTENEVLYKQGMDSNGISHQILVANPGSKALNPAFDVTPAEYITAFITEKGIFKPNDLQQLQNLL